MENGDQAPLLPALKRSLPGKRAEEVDILFQHQAAIFHDLGMGRAHIAEMPGLPGDAGHRLFALGIPQNKTESCPLPAESAADALIGE